MAISHLCLTCGFDLARMPARPDPHYALPMVQCPECGEAAIRRMHPSMAGWRTLLRLKTSLVALAFQLALLLGFTAAVVAVCVYVGERWVRGDLAARDQLELVAAILAFGALPILLGAWLTVGFSHVRRFWAWLAFAALAVVLISLDCVGEPLTGRLLEACGLSLSPVEFRWDRFTARGAVLAAIMSIATAGIPPGILARVGWLQWRRYCWRTRRRRLRARRTSR